MSSNNTKNYTATVINNPDGTTTEWVDPNIPSYKNRPISRKRIEEYQDNFGMWNPALGDDIKVAELPDGTRYKWDGSHRCEMWKEAFPGAPIRAKVVKARDEATISQWYEAVNKTGRKDPKPDELFMHQWDNEPDVVDCLNRGALKVVNGKDARTNPITSGPQQNTVGRVRSVPVPVAGVRKILKKEGGDATNIAGASRLLQRAMPGMEEMLVDLLGGMTIVYGQLDLGSPLHARRVEKVEKYLNNLYVNLYNQKPTHVNTFLKQKGGRVGNKDIESVALGILKGLKDSGTFKQSGFFSEHIKDLESKLKTKI